MQHKESNIKAALGLKNMYVFITGASRGIGFAIAEVFAKNGYNLLITSRSEVGLYKAMETLQTTYPLVDIKAKAFDISIKEQAIACGHWCLTEAVPTVVVNNAGGFEPGAVFNEPDGLLERQMATNLYSAYHLTRAVLPPMLERKSGHIFNICSIASLGAYGGAYSISKFALHGFSKNLREELKLHQIKVTAVFPGAVMTDSWGNFDNSQQRIMEATDIAKMVYAAAQLSPAACVEDIIMRPTLGDL
jgi:short-subunit dehydrogenase